MECCIVGNGLSLLERAEDRVGIPADPEVEPYLALLLWGCKRGDDVVSSNPGCLHTIQRKEDCLHKA